MPWCARLVGGVLLFSVAHLAAAQGPEEHKAIADFMRQYGAAVGTFDSPKVLPYYEEPLILVSQARTVVLPARADIEGFLNPFWRRLQERGWTGRSDSREVHVRQLSGGLALTSVLVVRYKADGEELERAGFSYLLRKSGDTWKIAVLVGHDVAGVKALD